MSEVTTRELKEVRKAKGFQQEQLAEHLKMPQSTYAYKEKHGGFSSAEKEKISKVLKTDMTSIVWNSPYPAKSGSESEKDRIIKLQEQTILRLESQVAKLMEMLNKALEKS
jgi:transcriptional regulator with XRE-family HTH domain